VVLKGPHEVVLGSAGNLVSFDDAPAWRRLDVGDAEGLSLRAVVSPAAPLLGQDERDIATRLLLIAGLAMDRTGRARALALTNKELEAANDALEAFVYTASHDLQNPLIAMLGYLDLLKNNHPYEPGSQPALWLERVETNGWFMSTLINDLLEFSRVGEIEAPAQLVDLGDMLERVREDAILRWPTLRVHVIGQLPTIRGTASRVQQLLSNIVSNTAHHGGEDVELTVAAERTSGGGIALSFHDDGPGVDPADAERIFRVFERINRADRERSGIGLAICRKIAESMDGSMWLEPSETGAHFVVTLGPDHVVPGLGTTERPSSSDVTKVVDDARQDHDDDDVSVDPSVLA
jgi:signal transduction histidine kinase